MPKITKFLAGSTRIPKRLKNPQVQCFFNCTALSAPRTCGVWLIHSGPGQSQRQRLFYCSFSSLLKLFMFLWLTSTFATISHQPQPQLLGSAFLPSLSLGTARSLKIHEITGKRISRGPGPHLFSHSLLASERIVI